MAKILEFKLPEEPYMEGAAYCRVCAFEWDFRSPLGVSFLECPRCSYQYAKPKYPARRDGAHWACHCGNGLFHITPDGCYCPFCGDWQVGF